jgi:hypothetical protein
MNNTDESHAVSEASNPANEDPRRKPAMARIERSRHFHGELVVTGIGVVILIAIGATTEYHNAGGWPTQGFSQSSGIHDVWNYRIIDPLIAVVLIVAVRAWACTATGQFPRARSRGRSNVSRVGDELIQPATCGADPK